MTETEVRQRLETEEDFVNLKRYDHSLSKLLERYPDGVPDHIAAQALFMTETDYDNLYQEIVRKLRRGIKAEE